VLYVSMCLKKRYHFLFPIAYFYNMEDKDPKRVRRVRYKGTHPKAFKEKYKELQPENYSEDIAKVIAQGRTPAGMHRSICVKEIMDFLQISPGQIGLDATLGYGGHSLEIIKCLLPNGKLYALDVDPFELPRTKERLASLGYGPEVVDIRKMNFSGIDQIVAETGPLNFVLADLGVSSMQIDNPERGFSFKIEGPLDLRLNPKSGKSAAALLKTIARDKLENLLLENADEPFAEQIAKAITGSIAKGAAVTTTTQLRQIIAEALEFIAADERKEAIKKSCQRCFQALRIEVNNEFGVLDKFLEKLPDALAPGGRVAILSFHSGEDRRVKKSFQHLFRAGIYSEVAPGPVRPSAEECNTNPRARSAKLRWAIKA
jgi:16S rRNA (cytosine1402-N4)-methyltransferase